MNSFNAGRVLKSSYRYRHRYRFHLSLTNGAIRPRTHDFHWPSIVNLIEISVNYMSSPYWGISFICLFAVRLELKSVNTR